MSYQLIVRPKAEQQITEAYNWYEEKLSGLGDEFLLSIDACLHYITRNPHTFQKRYKDIRAGLTDRFPFGIYYFIDNERIVIMAVFHLSRNPKLWKKGR